MKENSRVEEEGLATKLDRDLVMLGGILPAHWWRRDLSVNCRS